MVSKSDILNEFRMIERLCKQSSHGNIVAVYRYGQLGDSYYIDMELCEFNLEQYIYGFDMADRMLPALDMTTLLKIMRDVCRGLAFIHESKKLHRDIKPQNSIFYLIFNNI
jgi:serine/threonine protein kinase